MSSANLEKPSARTGAIIGGAKLGTTGTDFYFKVMGANSQSGSPGEDVTGDGDTYPRFENNGYLYESGTMTGAMIASQALGLANLINTAKNPVAITFDFGGTRRDTKTVLIEWMGRTWRRNKHFVGVSLRYRMTDTNPASIEGAVS